MLLQETAETRLHASDSVRFALRMALCALVLCGGPQETRAAAPVSYSGVAGRAAFEAAIQASGGDFVHSFSGLSDQPIGYAAAPEISALPHQDLYADGNPIPDCNQPGGVAICPITETYMVGPPSGGVVNEIIGGVLSVTVELGSTSRSLLSLDFDGELQQAYAWGAEFSGANGGSGVAVTIYYLDPSTPNGFVKTALRDAAGVDLYPMGDGFFGFVVPASHPIAKIELRPRVLSDVGIGSESFGISEMLGSIGIVSLPEPGSTLLWGFGIALLRWNYRRLLPVE